MPCGVAENVNVVIGREFMKRVLLLVTAAVLVGAAALAQLRITSFNSSGELT
jgi:hypothetical protein